MPSHPILPGLISRIVFVEENKIYEAPDYPLFAGVI